MDERKVKVIIDSDMENVYLVTTIIEALCTLISLSEHQLFEIRLCVAEAVNNCIIHAYGREPGHEVEVVLSLYPDKLVLNICDSGLPMDPSRLIDIQKNNAFVSIPDDVENMKTGGRGLPIIVKMMDKIAYSTDHNRNCLMMMKKIK